MLVHSHLARVGGEEKHDGEAGEQPCVLDGEDDDEAAASGLLLLPTHRVHLWELGGRRGNGERERASTQHNYYSDKNRQTHTSPFLIGRVYEYS